MRIAGHAYQVLSPPELGLIHSSALAILDQMGMEVQDGRLLSALAEIGARVDQQAQRATFPPPLVERFIADAPKHDWAARPTVRGSAGVYHSLYHDPETGRLVPWTEEALAAYLALPRRLSHVSDASMLGCRLAVPPPLEPLYERYYNWKLGGREGGSIHRDDLCPYLHELYQALASDRGQPIAELFRAAVYLVPALKLGRHEAHQVAYFWERGLRVHIGDMLTMGATTPATMAGAVALNLAEQLALRLLDWALYGERRLHLGAALSVMDMRTTIRPFGRPEMTITNLMTAQLARYYGASFSAQAGLTDAKLPSVEAGMQKAMTAVPAVLAGSSFRLDAGLLAIDEVCSPIQMVLDNELLSALEHLTREFTVDESSIGLETILSVGPGGHYLDQRHTVDYFRQEHWQPALWSRQMLGVWREEGGLLDADRARELALQARAEVRRQPPQGLSATLERDILDIIERARRARARAGEL